MGPMMTPHRNGYSFDREAPIRLVIGDEFWWRRQAVRRFSNETGRSHTLPIPALHATRENHVKSDAGDEVRLSSSAATR